MSKTFWIVAVVLFVVWLHWMIWMEYREKFWSRTMQNLRKVGKRARNPWEEEQAMMDELHRLVQNLPMSSSKPPAQEPQDSPRE